MSTTVVIFGASGDLAARLLYPALYRLEERGLLDEVRLVATALEDWTLAAFLGQVDTALAAHRTEPAPLERLRRRFSYQQGDLTPHAAAELAPLLSETNAYYLALPPGFFPTAAAAIAESGITQAGRHRLVVEKPFGTDGASAAALEDDLHRYWDERQIFRIDHYLGKETVQNLSVMRFANRVIEPLLRAEHVDQVQITVAETLGVEGRYRYYDGIGALRDMIQNHLMQLFCLAAMDAPAVWDADVLRDHKVEVMRAVRRPAGPVTGWASRGQYTAGSLRGSPVPGYLEEPGISAGSATETFAAVRLQVDSWRWQGIPFYLRSGKRLGADLSEIAFRFREPPTQLFTKTMLADAEPNWLVLRLDQPEGIDLFVQTRAPGTEMAAESSRLHTDFGSATEGVTAYEQLLLDVLEDDHTSFLRVDEVDWAWRILDCIIDEWSTGAPEPYQAGSSGPACQDSILLDGHAWRPLPE